MVKTGAIVIVLMAALAYGTAEATVFVVHLTSPACVSPSGGVFVPTIGAAMATAAAGDRIYVCPGTYPENVTVAPGQSDLNVFGIGRPVLVPGNPSAPGFTILASGVRVQGLEVSGFEHHCGIHVGAPPGTPPPPSPPGSVILIGNVLHDNAVGVCFFEAGGNEVRDNTIEGNGAGIRNDAMFTPVSTNLVIGNRIHRSSNVGVMATYGAVTRVDNNVISENYSGVWFSSVTGGVISRNTVVRNDHGISASGSNFEIAHNLVRENARRGISLVDAGNCSVGENTVARNGQNGIHLDLSRGPCQLYRNVVQQNEGVGINALSLRSGHSFIFNTASGNGLLDCNWDGSGAPLFADNRCRTENPAGAWD